MCAHLWWSMCASFIVVSVCPLHGGQHVPPLSWPVCTPFIFFQCVPSLFWSVCTTFILTSPLYFSQPLPGWHCTGHMPLPPDFQVSVMLEPECLGWKWLHLSLYV